MSRLIGMIEQGLRIVAALCLLCLTALVLAQVVLRYGGFGIPAATEELARYAMIWMAMLAAAVGVREGSHIRIESFSLALGQVSERARRWLEAGLDTVSLGIFLTLVWYGVDMVRFAAMQRSDGLRISLSWPYVIVPVAFALAALFALSRLFLRETRE